MTTSAHRKLLINVMVGLTATLATLVIAELVLRIRGGNEARTHRLDYRDTWRESGLGPGGYLKENFSAYVENGFGGAVRWTNNSKGFRNDSEFQIPRSLGTFRVLSMGDSFVGGYRVGQEETFSRLLQENLSRKHPLDHIEVMVSVIEDPLTGLFWLGQYGLQYEPNLILLGVTLGNDLTQIYTNLETEMRAVAGLPSSFMNDSGDQAAREAWLNQMRNIDLSALCLTPRDRQPGRQGPKWSHIFRSAKSNRDRLRLITYLRRMRSRLDAESPQTVLSDSGNYAQPKLLESHGLGLFLKNQSTIVAEAFTELFVVLEKFRDLARFQSFDLIVLLFPQRFQVQPLDWQATIDIYGLDEACFDLELPTQKILEFCTENDIRCVDLTVAMSAGYLNSRRSLYLAPHDMHWNSAGHRAVADSLLPLIDDLFYAELSDR